MKIDFSKNPDGLVPAIIQDAETRQVLMLGYMNAEALQRTLDSKLVTFWSRSRQTLWTKGETSGNLLHLVDIKVDCDEDTLLVRVHPDGPTCHKGTDTCWGEVNAPAEKSAAAAEGDVAPSASAGDRLAFLAELQDVIEQRHAEMPEGSYTTSLFRDGTNRMAQKVGEEALELVIEAVDGNNERMLYEGADMLYHLEVLLTSKGLRFEDLVDELRQRHQPGWRKH